MINSNGRLVSTLCISHFREINCCTFSVKFYCSVTYFLSSLNTVTNTLFRYTLYIFLLYAWSSLPFTYLLSNIFSTPASGYVWTTVLTLLLGKCNNSNLEPTSVSVLYKVSEIWANAFAKNLLILILVFSDLNYGFANRRIASCVAA